MPLRAWGFESPLAHHGYFTYQLELPNPRPEFSGRGFGCSRPTLEAGSEKSVGRLVAESFAHSHAGT